MYTKKIKKYIVPFLIGASLYSCATLGLERKNYTIWQSKEEISKYEKLINQLTDTSCVNGCGLDRKGDIVDKLIADREYINCTKSCLSPPIESVETAPELDEGSTQPQQEAQPETPTPQPQQAPQPVETPQPQQAPQPETPTPQPQQEAQPESLHEHKTEKREFRKFGYLVELDRSKWGTLYLPEITCDYITQKGRGIEKYAIFDENGKVGEADLGSQIKITNITDGTYWVFGLRDDKVVASYQFTKEKEKITINANWAEKGELKKKGIKELNVTCNQTQQTANVESQKSECDLNNIELEVVVDNRSRSAECRVKNSGGCTVVDDGIIDSKGDHYYFSWYSDVINANNFFKQKTAKIVGQVYCAVGGKKSNAVNIQNNPPNIEGIYIEYDNKMADISNMTSVRVPVGAKVVVDIKSTDQDSDSIYTKLTFNGKEIDKSFTISERGTLDVKVCDDFGACSQKEIYVKLKGQYVAAIRDFIKAAQNRPYIEFGLSALTLLAMVGGYFVYKRRLKKAIEQKNERIKNLKALAQYYKVDLDMLNEKDEEFDKIWNNLKDENKVFDNRELDEIQKHLKIKMAEAEEKVKNKNKEELIENLEARLGKKYNLKELDLTEKGKEMYGDDYFSILTFCRLNEMKMVTEKPILSADIRLEIKNINTRMDFKNTLGKYFNLKDEDISAAWSQLNMLRA